MSEQGVATPPITEQIGAATPQPSLRDELSHAFNEIKDKGEKPNPNVNAPAETQETKAARQRDQERKFTQPDRKTLTLPEKTPAAPAAIAPTQEAAPPVSWTAPMKEEFSKLPANVKAYIAEQETNARKALTAQDEDRTTGKKIRETAAPYLAAIKAEGGDPAAAFGAFLNYAHIMRSGTPQQKAMALQQVARQYNVPFGASPEQAPSNPAFESLSQRLNRIEQERQAEVQQRQVQEQSDLTNQIESFKTEPGHEHYEQVKVLMGNLLLSEQATTLQEAYDQAIWANPEIRSTLTAAQTAEAEQKRLAANQQQTGAAKWASGSVVGGPGGIIPKGPIAERSLGDEIRANMKAATGRV